jgi:hypothetical protein
MLDAIFRHNNAATKYNICYSFDSNEISSPSLLISLASLFFRITLILPIKCHIKNTSHYKLHGGDWRKLHHNLYSSPTIIRMIKSRRI